MKYLALIFLLINYVSLSGQPPDKNKLLQALADNDKTHIRLTDSILLKAYDGSSDEQRKQLLDFYKGNAGSSNLLVSARSYVWLGVIILRPPFNNNDRAFEYLQQAIRRAIESGDEHLMAYCFEMHALTCMIIGKSETALFYFLKSGEIRSRIGDKYLMTNNADFYGSLGDLLFKMREYREAIHYIKLLLADSRTPAAIYDQNMNTIALAYQNLGMPDSALYWYQKAMEAAISTHDSVWQGITNGNMGGVYFDAKKYDEALPLLWKDYYATVKTEPINAGNTLQSLALIYLERNKLDSALLLARQAYSMVTAAPPYSAGVTRNASEALSQVFKKLGNTDSAFFYSDIYHHIKDSLILVNSSNRVDVVQAKLDFEKLSNNINVLLTEKQAEKARRNFLLAGIVLLLATAWFYFRWQRQQYLNRQQELLHRQQMTEAEMNNAREKLEEFTRHLIEKNQLIENLQDQLVQQNRQVNDELQNQSILTESDWLRFKDMFEKANPGFIYQLQASAPGITTAELRLAALLRLNLGNKHIASMLGIGTDAVRKTKSRLRQRLQITVDDGLEDYIRSLSLSN